MKRSFTKEELGFLSEYESRFKTASELGFIRNLEPRYLLKIKKIYEDATGTNESVNMTCSHCVLTFIKKVGLKYFKDKEEYVDKAAEVVNALDEVFNEVPDEKVQNKPEPKRSTKPARSKSNNKATNKK